MYMYLYTTPGGYPSNSILATARIASRCTPEHLASWTVRSIVSSTNVAIMLEKLISLNQLENITKWSTISYMTKFRYITIVSLCHM